VTRASLVAIALLASCGGGHHDSKPPAHDDAGRAAGSDAGTSVVLPPPPDIPAAPHGLPISDKVAVNPLFAPHLALGELLFFDARLSSTRTIACATCHDPAHDYSGDGRQKTAAGAPNLRRAPSLTNLVYRSELGWDGRYTSLDDQLPSHIRGQLGDELAAGVARIAELPIYRAHFARVGETDKPGERPARSSAAGGAESIDTRPADELALTALEYYVRTRYQGDSPWDKVERGTPPPELAAGYQLFMGKAQCSVCHPPPLYTDFAYHRLGLVATKDEGHGRVAPDQAGAFVTPGLRGAGLRPTLFHDGSATSLDAAIDWHLAGGTGQGADPSIIDPALKPIKLSTDERAKLGAFVRALTNPTPAKPRPTLP